MPKSRQRRSQLSGLRQGCRNSDSTGANYPDYPALQFLRLAGRTALAPKPILRWDIAHEADSIT